MARKSRGICATPKTLTNTRKLRSVSAKTTRKIIRSRHALLKDKERFEREGDAVKVKQIEEQLEDLGGIQIYQQASLLGQDRSRGGDTSELLVDWLKQFALPQNLRLLEVGALSSKNACSRSGIFATIERIDLNSQEKDIKQQDFFERPLPESTDDQFHVISLSLVVNYVPDRARRGLMLKLLRSFLLPPESCTSPLPCVFLVLPAACIHNSRYCDSQLLVDIMTSLGYKLSREKISHKLAYWLWTLLPASSATAKPFPKREIHSGSKRNNFCIEL
ncbi:hypothetical protein CANCADRAFT_30467 [Tortispora caseinolytica NRRL Y-17796]|uniref:25S rRNA adenine-N(1) methyltransferase n=1 Tax=Tortispora caseinolytica NRRL Y-17796 TaxID=767744 RepID=A0A1E4TKS1_9ASCO|nr:hypothetical protein CANCADRAFT_30467 [Tortispora caseinolytica NRRL Y-17796]